MAKIRPPSKSPADAAPFGRPPGGWRLRLYGVIFESDTRTGRLFDVVLVVLILVSVTAVLLESVAPLRTRYGVWFDRIEWTVTVLFTIEYIARLACVERPLQYARSFYGVVDLLAVLPADLAIVMPGLGLLIDVRVLRLLRIFRIFKLGEYVSEFGALSRAIAASRRKILVFLSFVLLVVLVMGTLMYVVEGPANGFTSIPTAVYWSITTMTTVGFGDLTPKSNLGRLIASVMMLIGWGTLAVPTGIVSAEFTAQRFDRERARGREAGGSAGAAADTTRCAACGSGDHARSARFCRDCGAALGACAAAEQPAADRR